MKAGVNTKDLLHESRYRSIWINTYSNLDFDLDLGSERGTKIE